MYSVSYTHYNFWRESRVRTLKKKVWLALYRERRECVISAWSSGLRNIREGMIRGSKACLSSLWRTADNVQKVSHI